MSANKTLLICRCAGRRLLNREALEPLLRQDGAIPVSDLCGAAAAKDPVLGQIAGADAPVVCACHPRAVRALFAFAGFPLPQNTEFINLRIPSGGPSAESDTAWYPVLDEDRCTNCGQCFEFCLFGVYEKDSAGKIRVVNPHSCKNNCPACARICPAAAIIFPKVGEAPINGAEISDEEALKANIRINVDEILGGDVYAALNARKQKRRSLLDQKKVEQALAERKKCSEDKA
ncbi:MAG TPA: ferredoxin family protein [Pontiellaceae bacterium]|nr:ferredoxin family protein [Pontiellaceae bacterium]HPR82817.1 ferredoxin family protein [Pontiellaceae bacterium]